jgi:hypothetical protein
MDRRPSDLDSGWLGSPLRWPWWRVRGKVMSDARRKCAPGHAEGEERSHSNGQIVHTASRKLLKQLEGRFFASNILLALIYGMP